LKEEEEERERENIEWKINEGNGNLIYYKKSDM